MRYLPLFLLLIACTAPADPPTEATHQASRHEFPADQPIKFILDADTANEIDDLYAIAYLFEEEKIDFLGLSSAQWFHVLSGDSTVYQSQKLNEELLTLAGRMDLPHPLGADMIMGKPWGGYAPRDSPAARFIINQAMGLPEGEKLVVMCIGASTNLASAIAMEPAIKDKIVAYVLGHRYDEEGGFWNKDEFNIRRDLNAANYLLDAEGLELHVMPVSTAIQYTWQREATFAKFDRGGPIGEYLKNRWATFSPESTQWTMWDVALLQAFLAPEQATEISVITPPENAQRGVWMYTDIDETTMEADFWERIVLE